MRVEFEFLAFPGSLLVFVFVVMPLNLLLGSGDIEAADPFRRLLHFTGGALVNVLLVWAGIAVCRRWRGHLARPMS